MNVLPEWPAAPGPRVLTLVGNDVTIDVRARKTASALARNGYSVICIGIDAAGARPRSEILDGALLWRVRPSLDPRLSPRLLRFSAPELRDHFWYRLEMRRQRLQSRRRALTAYRSVQKRQDPKWVRSVGDIASKGLRRAPDNSLDRHRLRAGLDRRLRYVDRKVRFGVPRLVLILDQKLTGLTQLTYKWFARRARNPRGSGNWRRDLPELHRYEAALGGVVDALKPDLIHVHDVFHIGVAARAKARAEAEGEDLWVVYDAHEYVPGLPLDDRRRLAYTELESEYIHDVDAVVAVAPEMAEAISAYHGIPTPRVVANAPDTDTAIEVSSVREVCRLTPEEPLVAYVGGIAAHRGADLMLEAMSKLPRAHLALVVGEVTAYIQGLLDSASEYNLEGRLHAAPFVPPEGVVSYLRGTDLTLIPLSRDVKNYDVTLPNKLFQSIQAGVPVVVSDSPAMARFVREHGVGEVFEGGSPTSLAEAIHKVLENPAVYREALADSDLLKKTTWASQLENLLETYADLGVTPS